MNFTADELDRFAGVKKKKASQGSSQGKAAVHNNANLVPKKYRLITTGASLDLPFLLLIVVTLVIGIVMMFSASYPTAFYRYNNSNYFLVRQSIFAAIGLVIMLILSRIDYHWLRKLTVPVLAGAWLLMIIVLIVPSKDETKRWLNLGVFSIQASEVCKFALILFFANWGSIYYKKMHTIKYGIMPAVVVMAITGFLLYLEPHYSGIVICLFILVFMLFLSGVQIRYFLIAGGGVAAIAAIMAVTGKLSYAMSRLDGWGQALIYTDEDMWQSTWQTRNSLYAIGSGGLWGLGLGQSRQKYLYLPEPQNDFVFAIVCEELGLIGAGIILTVFAMLVWRGIHLSRRAPDRFGMLLGIGLMAQIGLQVVLNIMVITDFLPNTGISLPFFSYGGSSLVMLLAQMGIVLNISRSSREYKS